MIVSQNEGQRPTKEQPGLPGLPLATEKAKAENPLIAQRTSAPQLPDQPALTEAQAKMKTAFAQGFMAKCAEEGVDPTQLIKTAFGEEENPDSRLLAYLSQLLPIYGPAAYGWTPETGGRGALKGLAGQVGGGVLGSSAGGAAGAGLGALISLLSKGRVPMSTAARAGTALGGIPGAVVGGGEGIYRATKKGKKKPAPEKK